jgi:hypothetical protein
VAARKNPALPRRQCGGRFASGRYGTALGTLELRVRRKVPPGYPRLAKEKARGLCELRIDERKLRRHE